MAGDRSALAAAPPTIDFAPGRAFRSLPRMFQSLRVTAFAALIWAIAAAPPAEAASDQVVVELFTSQGCSSCPPADRYFSELAGRTGVIALAFHVDYWNYIGWRDPFSSPAWSQRQKAYGAALGLRYVYTPQMVIDGTAETVGSKRGQVERLLKEARRSPKLDVHLSHPGDGMIRIEVPARPSYDSAPATIWIAFYDTAHLTEVRAGENRGMVLRDRNVVRMLSPVGTWQGGPVDVTLSLEALGSTGRDACAVLVQAAGNGAILGAGTMSLPADGR